MVGSAFIEPHMFSYGGDHHTEAVEVVEILCADCDHFYPHYLKSFAPTHILSSGIEMELCAVILDGKRVLGPKQVTLHTGLAT